MGDFAKLMLALVGAFLICTVGAVTCSYINTAAVVATAPSRVITRTMGTSNIIQNYELFYDLNEQFKARSNQIAVQQGVLDAETDADERRRLRMELGAMQQSCRDIAAQYNANSEKLNRNLFKANNLPENLTCVS